MTELMGQVAAADPLRSLTISFIPHLAPSPRLPACLQYKRRLSSSLDMSCRRLPCHASPPSVCLPVCLHFMQRLQSSLIHALLTPCLLLPPACPPACLQFMQRLQNKHSFGFNAVSLGYFDTLMSLSGMWAVVRYETRAVTSQQSVEYVRNESTRSWLPDAVSWAAPYSPYPNT